MPQALPLIATAVGVALQLPAWGTALLTIGASLAVQQRAQRHDSPYAAPDPGKLINFRDTQASVPIIYGRVKLGGDQVFLCSTGENNKLLHIVQTIGEGEIDHVEDIYLGDKQISEFGSYAYNEIFKGAPSQNRCETLYQAYNNWNDCMRNTAYMYLRLEYNGDKFANFPIITALVRGLKVLDPRTSQIVWTQNPALIVYDYIINARYGVGISTDFWDVDSVKDAANWCDTKGYNLNCVIANQRPGLDVAQELLNSCRLALKWSDGEFKMLPLDWDASVMTLTEDDIKEETFKITVPGVSNFPNALRLKFKNKDNGYVEEDLVLHDPTAISLDGEQREHVINVLDTDYEQVAKIGAYHLDRRRLNRSYNFIAGPKAIPLEPGDIIKVSHTLPGWTERAVRVQDAQILPNWEVALTVVEEEAALYDDTVNIMTHAAWTTQLPDPLAVPPPVSNVQFSEELYTVKDNTFIRIIITWDDPPNYPFLDHVEVWASQSEAGPYKNMGNHINSFVMEGAKDAETWYFKLLSVSMYGVRMAIATTSPYEYTTIGKTSVPPDITGFSGAVAGDTVHLSWDAVPITDLFGYVIRFGYHWNTSILLGFTKAQMYSLVGVKPGLHVFLIKAQDTLGQYSNASAMTSVRVFIPSGYAEKHSYYNDFSSGTFENTEAIDDPEHGRVLRVIHSGGLTGSYTSPVYDLSNIYIRRHWLEFTVVSGSKWNQVFDPGELWTDELSPDETWLELFSSLPVGTLMVKFYHSKDNEAWYEVDKFEILSCEVEARYFKYKITITDNDQDNHLLVKPCTEKGYYWQ